jgi:hypothetical protein
VLTVCCRKFLYQPALPFAVVAALLRLGRKYDFRDVLDSTVERITFENPKTLEEFDALPDVDGIYLSTRIASYYWLEFDTPKLARENDILSALPIAYYRAAMCGLVCTIELPRWLHILYYTYALTPVPGFDARGHLEARRNFGFPRPG